MSRTNLGILLGLLVTAAVLVAVLLGGGPEDPDAPRPAVAGPGGATTRACYGWQRAASSGGEPCWRGDDDSLIDTGTRK